MLSFFVPGTSEEDPGCGIFVINKVKTYLLHSVCFGRPEEVVVGSWGLWSVGGDS